MTRIRTLAPLSGVGLGLVLLLAGCSGGGTTNPPAGTPSAGASAAPSGAPQPETTPGARANPGVSGTIAYVSGQLMQVQDSSMQTAVAWTSATTFRTEVSGTLADVTAGECVVASGALTGVTGSTAAPTPSATAVRVTITEPVDGKCAAGMFGGAGGFPGGRPTAMPGGDGGMPEGRPTDLPSGIPTGGSFGNDSRAFGARTAGLVTAVDGSTITVQVTGQDGTTTTATATVDASTTYTKTVAADASAVVVGQCASAFGTADSSGKVTATSVTVSAPVDGTCSSLATGRAGSGLTGSRTGGSGQGYRNHGTGSTGTTGGTNA